MEGATAARAPAHTPNTTYLPGISPAHAPFKLYRFHHALRVCGCIPTLQGMDACWAGRAPKRPSVTPMRNNQRTAEKNSMRVMRTHGRLKASDTNSGDHD